MSHFEASASLHRSEWTLVSVAKLCEDEKEEEDDFLSAEGLGVGGGHILSRAFRTGTRPTMGLPRRICEKYVVVSHIVFPQNDKFFTYQLV